MQQSGELAVLEKLGQSDNAQTGISKIKTASDDKFKGYWRPALGWVMRSRVFVSAAGPSIPDWRELRFSGAGHGNAGIADVQAYSAWAQYAPSNVESKIGRSTTRLEQHHRKRRAEDVLQGTDPELSSQHNPSILALFRRPDRRAAWPVRGPTTPAMRPRRADQATVDGWRE